MNYSRRDLSMLFPALASAAALGHAAAEGTSLASKIYPFDGLPVHASGPNRSRPVLEGETHAGTPVELHMTELAPGQAPHPPHHHLHEELLLMLEGTVEVTIAGKSANLGPGSAAFVRSNDEHGWRNVGTARARYFVLALGRDNA